jgi:Fur family peroxide stress response transcriptional regulator
MDEKYVHLSDELVKRNIRPSHQRLKILEYFYLHQNHPTADEIFHVLKKNMPTLSKGTIYNTLKAFVQNKLVWEISIEENEARYDLYTRRHGHFKCNSCGAIYDFVIQIDELPVKGLSNFQIEDKSVYFKGICPKCLKDINQNH